MELRNQIWVNSPNELKEKLHIKFFEMGPVVDHNLMCWLCNKNPAVYSMHPEWVFKPCWECQGFIKDARKKGSWWKALFKF